ncbi:MAG: hypothetical protein IKL55_03715 [Clostridia bacterium]|nr:hypothetical protein [Clostridia bacterium]
MKLQGVSVIFALIVLPLILVLTYYIHLQVDTLQLQNEFDKKLLDSTYGAMSAFEINTANEDLSSVSDALRTIIEASNNVFFNTLATNLGMSNASKSYLEPYIPALLYTLYDGYYISTPTRTPQFLIDSDGNAVSVGDIGLDVSGSNYSYKEVHTSEESEKNCTNCDATHVKYADYIAMDNAQKSDLQIKYDDLTDVEKENYGQLVYIKKKANKDDPDAYTTNIDDAEYEINHVLKTYMPYSARYKRDNKFDIVAIYTLDNYLSIEGTINNIYYTKSGYFIPKNSVEIKTGPSNLMSYSQDDAKKYIESGQNVEIFIRDKMDENSGNIVRHSGADDIGVKILSGGHGSKAELEENIRVQNNRYSKVTSYLAQINSGSIVLSEELKSQLSNGTGVDFSDINISNHNALNEIYTRLSNAELQIQENLNNTQYELDKLSAVTYYVTASIFSNWIYENLATAGSETYEVLEKDLVEISGQSYKLIKGKLEVSHDFEDSENPVFDIENITNREQLSEVEIEKMKEKSNMEIDVDSPFYSHKLNVIRDSIQYNLNLSMSTYNNMLISNKDYAMPVMENEEWEKILNHVSIIAFMQGYDCGLKNYSNYKIVSSTNNEITVLPREVYYVKQSEFSNEKSDYHRIDCPKLRDMDTSDNTYLSFISKEAKYDKLFDKTNAQIPYKYDHKNLACYECINDGNYLKTDIFDTIDNSNYDTYKNLRKAYYIGVGKSRNNLYKMNAITNSDGYEIIYDKESHVGGIANTSSRNIADIKAIEIVLDTVKSLDSQENVLNFQIRTTYGDELNSNVYTIVPNVTTNTTLRIEVNPNITRESKISASQLIFNNTDPLSAVTSENVKNSIKFVKVIYR